MKDKEPSEGAEIQTRPAQARNKFFWAIVLVAAALTLVLSVGVGRLIGVALLSRSMAQTEVMPTAVPTGSTTGSSAGATHAVEIPGEGRVIFPKGSPEPAPSATARVLSVGTPTPQNQPKITSSPNAALTAAAPATPSVKVVVSRSTPTPSPVPPSPHSTAAPTPKPTFAPIIQITPAPLMGGAANP